MVDQTTQYVKSVVLRLVQKTMVDWQWLTRCPLPKPKRKDAAMISKGLRRGFVEVGVPQAPNPAR